MKFYASILTLFLLQNFLSAQYSIKGKIVNQENQPVEFLDVSIIQNDSIIDFITTNTDGTFLLKTPKGEVELLIEEMGKVVEQRKIAVNNDLDVGNIAITSQQLGLKEVLVQGKAKTYERLVDRLVFNVENSIAAIGGDALDALKNTPSVKIKDDQISIVGKSTVNVLVNDRIVQMSGNDLTNYLKSIPSANIKKIEVITNPPAKYEAEGNSGLINIVLKEAKQNAWSTTLRSSYTQGVYGILNDGINFSYSKDKFSALVDLSHYTGNNIYTNDMNYDYPTEHWNQKVRNKKIYRGFSGLTTLSYKINDKNTVGIQFNGGHNYNGGKERTRTISNQNGQIIKDFSTNSRTGGDGDNYNLNLNFTHKFDTIGKKFSVDLDYMSNTGANENDFISDMYFKKERKTILANNLNDKDIQNISGKIDFYFPHKKGTWEFGSKVSSTESDYKLNSVFTDINTNENLMTQNDHFNYTENVESLYLSYQRKLSDKWSTKIGLRGEFMQSKANSITTNTVTEKEYFKLFPTFYIQYQPTEDHSFNFNFGRRIQRPAFWELNPNKWYSNPISYTEGNPFMQPAFVYNFELSYGFKDYLQAKVYYQNIQDGFGQIAFHQEQELDGELTQTQIFKRLNYYKMSNYGISLSSTLKPYKWWESNLEFNFGFNKSINEIDVLDKEYTGNGANFSVYNNLNLNPKKTFTAQANYTFTPKGKNREFNYSSSSSLDIGFKYLAMDKKLTLSLMAYDIFKTDLSTLSTNVQNIPQSFRQYYDSKSIRFSVSYKFGNSKINVSKRQTSNAEETNRSGGK